ncbi:Palmitoyltransferase [Madurella fahalii]|uniref:Palmitoyltransferase PFA4 n=1 Tax=Madurella fahalii TaxID=1157608 RepID=A0ABQ0FXM5_9PEZI
MTSLKTGPSTPGLHVLYIPAVCLLIAFQGYFSQYLFNTAPNLAPGHLTRRQTLTFNTLLVCVWWTYYLACTVDPGRYKFPAPSSDKPDPDLRPTSTSTSTSAQNNPERQPRTRWCRKCASPKPPRAHHCRHCRRCIPKMDHHCPWTGTCVSMQTFPYFLRFLVYTNLALWYLGYLLVQRARGVWAERNLPAYLGPSLPALVGLTVLGLLNAATAAALGILLYTTVKGWVFNATMIEEWEVERHEAVLGRILERDEGSDGEAGGNFWGDDDVALRQRLERIEFPYDLGVFANMAQAMGTRNPLRWFLPVFGGGPVINNETPGKGPGWEWEENGFNDLPGLWPPPDPEKMRRQKQGGWPGAAARQLEGKYDEYQTAEEVKAAFARRQEEDLQRRQRAQARTQQPSGIIAELEEADELNSAIPHDRGEDYEWVGKPVWTNSEGDRLWDYGVDEEVEEEIVPGPGDDDDVPLAELIRRRKVLTREEDG